MTRNQPSGRSSSQNLAAIQTKYTDRSPLVRFANRRFHETIYSLVTEVSFESALDAGSGEGVILASLEGQTSADLVGLDIDHARLLEARTRLPKAPLVRGNLQRLPFPDDSFDLVLCLEVLEHVGQPSLAVRELHRVTRRYLLASVPNEPWWRIGNMLRLKYLRDWGNTPEHINHWSTGQFVRFLKPHFGVIEIRRPMLWSFVLANKNRNR